MKRWRFESTQVGLSVQYTEPLKRPYLYHHRVGYPYLTTVEGNRFVVVLRSPSAATRLLKSFSPMVIAIAIIFPLDIPALPVPQCGRMKIQTSGEPCGGTKVKRYM